MTKPADVVIIGGGIIGTAVAFHLSQTDIGRIVLLEREPFLGAGATSKAAGGIRAQFANRVNIEMSMLSEKLFCQFEEDTGSPALFDRVGYMFVLKDETDVANFKQSYKLQRSLGLNVQWLENDEIAQHVPEVDLSDVLAATFCSDDGLGDPHEFLSGYDKAIRRAGVEVILEANVQGITITSGKISSVQTEQDSFSCGLVINCAGPQGGQIGQLVGADVKVMPIKRQIVTTGELSFVRPDFPMVVDVRSGLYCHKESKGMLLGWADKSIEPSSDLSIDPDYTDAIVERALELIPQLETAGIANQWAGLYESTPDHRAIIGHEPSVGGMFHVTGFSGHGFMHAPAAGMITAEILTGKKPSVDISSLSPERFANGELVKETNVI